jgi:hypothetical protein
MQCGPPKHQAANLLCRYWQCQPGAPEPASPPASPNSTIVVTLVFQFPVGSAVRCSGIDLAAAEKAVLQRAQTLSASTGRSYSGAGATCSEVPVPSGAGRRRLLGATQTVLEVSAASAGPAEGVDPLAVAVSVQSSVASEFAQVLDEAVQVPGYNAAADVQNMSVQLQQVAVDGQELLRSPPPAEVAAGGWDAALPIFQHAALHLQCAGRIAASLRRD